MRSMPRYAGAGALRADIRAVSDVDDPGVSEGWLADPQMRPLIANSYAAWELRTASPLRLREVTPALRRGLSGSA
jgi:hypothetical protein